MHTLAIVIVNYNVCYFLEQTLLSVRKAVQGIDAEVWVIDNASHDDSVQMVQERFPEVHLIANTDNVGFSRANNQGIRLCSSRYVLLLNPDTVVEETAFRTCIDFMDAHPDAGGLGVKMIDGQGIFLPESKRGLPTPWVAFYKIFGLSGLFPRSKTFGRYHLGFLSKEEVQEVEVLSGAFMLMRSDALNKIGLLDEDYFMYGEDIDLSYRLIKGGYKNYYLPTARILHYKGESTKKGSLNYVFVFYQAMLIFARKHFDRGQAGFYSILIKLAVYLRAAFAVLRRFAEAAWPVVLDTALIFIGMYFLKTYWENNHKFVPDYYPPAFMLVVVPVYILFWLGSVYLSGGYDRPAKPSRIIRGVVVGTVLIAAASNFADAYRFSKALIVLGGIWSIIALIGVRLLRHFIRYRDLRMGEKALKRILLVGSEEEAGRAKSLLKEADVDARICGRISPGNKQTEKEDILGSLNELDRLTRIYEADEVIFCSREVEVTDILNWMERLSKQPISFRILPEGSNYIIGSASKNSRGDFYQRDTRPVILHNSSIRAKKLLDLSVAALLLLFSPVLVWFSAHKTGYFLNCLRVLSGSYSWVGLPEKFSELSPGILHPADKFGQEATQPQTRNRIGEQYLYTYTPFSDLDVLFKAFRLIGRKPVKDL